MPFVTCYFSNMSWWDSYLSPISTLLTFSFVMGMGFLALCVLFDDRPEAPLRIIRPFVRIIITSLSAMLLCVGLFLWLVYGFPDHIDPTYLPPTTGEEVLRCVCTVALWPIVLTSFILHRDPPLLPLWLIPTGLIWGFIIEVLFLWTCMRAKTRQGSN